MQGHHICRIFINKQAKSNINIGCHNSSYRDKLAEEVNDRLQEQGHVTVAELAKSYDLPPEFLREVVEEKIGKVIKGQVDSQDKDVIFTDSFVSRMTAKIRGAFSALTVWVCVRVHIDICTWVCVSI